MGLFDPRVAFKPFEYPEVTDFKDAINHSYWLVSEWNFQADIQDFKTRLNPHQQQVIKDTLLAISQVEVAVKKYWTRLGEKLPKPEFEQIAVTFGESEVRHADAYSHLLQVLDLNQDFEQILEVPCMAERVVHLAEMMSGQGTLDGFITSLGLFSSFVENVSLFAQFAIVKSFNKHLAVLKDVDNVIQATQKEETVHAMFGHWLVNKIREEYPGVFTDEFESHILEWAEASLLIEHRIIDWIFRDGDLEFLTAATLKEFVLDRLNESLVAMGMERTLRPPEQDLLVPLRWFYEEIHADVHTDFFHKRPVTYAKKTKPITEGDLF